MKKWLFVVVFFALAISLVSAEMLISQPASLYNRGDEISIVVTLSPGSTTSGFLSSSLICGENNVELYKAPYKMLGGTQKTVTILATLDKSFIGDLKGNCYVQAKYGSDAVQTGMFEISDSVSVNLNLGGLVFDPEANVPISGKAIKKNGKELNGFVEISVSGLNFSVTNTVSNGTFSTNFSVPGNAPAGEYQVVARAYESDSSGSIINEGSNNGAIQVRKVIRKIAIGSVLDRVLPGEEFRYTVHAYDQAEMQSDEEIAVVVTRPDNSIFVKKLVKTEEEQVLQTEQNYASGSWNIEASLGNISYKKSLYLEEFANASFQMVNGTLVVINTGNVPYSKPIEISIGGVVEIKDVYVNVGETKELRLYAPDGEYDISVNDGSTSHALGRTALTGNALAVEDITNAIGTKGMIFAWLVLIALLGWIILHYYKRKAPSSPAPRSSGFATYGKVGDINTKAVSDRIDSGHKEECAVIVLSVKNTRELERSRGAGGDALAKIMTYAKEQGAKIYGDKEYKTFVLSPSVTRDPDNALKAAKLAQRIRDELVIHNRKFAQKIKFGIGIHIGELLVEGSGAGIKIMSYGTTIATARKIADGVDSDLLLSSLMHRKVMNNIKCEQAGNGLWKITRVIDRSQHTEFINRFMKKQGS